jgi:PIN domain nuclease of toxin-antitoxin system
MKYVLDTHAWIWWNMHPNKLSTKTRNLLSTPKRYEELLLSAISPWEFCKLLEKGRLGISCSPEAWIADALDMPKLRIVPLTPAIAYRSTSLPQPFHEDPADQIIVATARAENATIISKDNRIRHYMHVRSLW